MNVIECPHVPAIDVPHHTDNLIVDNLMNFELPSVLTLLQRTVLIRHKISTVRITTVVAEPPY